jgi:hypothetical protein
MLFPSEQDDLAVSRKLSQAIFELVKRDVDSTGKVPERKLVFVLSFEAVAALRARGYLVRRLEDGYPEWKVTGLPIEAVA